MLPVLLILTLAGAYALGRSSVHAADSRVRAPLDVSSVASFRAAFEQPDALERSLRFHGFLQTLSSQDVTEAAELVETWNPWLVEDELLGFMIAWTRFDAPAAFAWGRSRPGVFREAASAAALHAWAFRDPVAARKALEAAGPSVGRVLLEEFFVEGWLKGGHREGVMEFLVSRPPGLLRQRYTNLLTIELMRDGSDAVIEWAEAIPDDAPGSFKAMAFDKAANILATVDPVLASGWIEGHLSEGYAAGTPVLIGRRWLEIDPAAAVAWLAGLPRGAAQDEALRATLVGWSNEAPEDAEAWVVSVADTGAGRAAIDAMIAQHAHDPATAMGWAQRIPDLPERFAKQVRLGRTWRRRDPEAARKWVEQSDLSAALQDAILNPPAQRPRRAGAQAADTAAPLPGS